MSSLTMQNELYQGSLTLFRAVYGASSSHEADLRMQIERLQKVSSPSNGMVIQYCIEAIVGSLTSLRAEIDAGLLGSLRANITTDILTDFIKLARQALDTPGDEAKNVAAVLTAAAFEDSIRRLAEIKGIGHKDKLADTLIDLKIGGYLQGAQVGVAQSYLSFRNKALHAQWQEVDRTVVESVLAFTEQLLIQAF